MSENQQPNLEPLEVAIQAFQRMTVSERPADAEVLGQFGIRQGDLSRPSCIPIPSKRRYLMHLMVSSTAAAVLLFGGVALFLRNSSPPEPVQVAATASSDKWQDVAVQPPPGSEKVEREGLGSFEQLVADAQVVVVATALHSAPAPPKSPGDAPEVLIRFQVKRVLKGKLDRKEITTRTPTAAAEFIGKDWIILLSPEYMAGKHQLASCTAIEFEPTVKAILAKDKPGDVAVKPPPRTGEIERLPVDSLKQRAADSQVIVVATALDSAPAPATRPGDAPEFLIRFQVKSVLKGELDKKEITTRTSTAASEFIGKEWIIWLSPEYMAGKHQFAACTSIKFEPTVKAILAKDTDPLSTYPRSDAFAANVAWHKQVGKNEIRISRFLGGDAAIALVCTTDLSTNKVTTSREVYNWASQNTKPRDLSSAQGRTLTKLVKSLPPSAITPELKNLILVSVVEKGQAKTYLYNRSDPPRDIIRLYDLTGADLDTDPAP